MAGQDIIDDLEIRQVITEQCLNIGINQGFEKNETKYVTKCEYKDIVLPSFLKNSQRFECSSIFQDSKKDIFQDDQDCTDGQDTKDIAEDDS